MIKPFRGGVHKINRLGFTFPQTSVPQLVWRGTVVCRK